MLESFLQRCNEQLPEVAPHGCGMNRLAQRLLRMNRAPGFGGFSRTAAGKKADSQEDRRGLYYMIGRKI
ncbi:hypothetical protein [Parageobacillus thermoglucosidasius]|uniref:hypothetical protein n=1 Tax=Parageobacillus thermoglucosidasius TaxID=1426 RepID=UPI000E162ACA|nr:hypothetical protein [Parageobacillus thermoglucosidasius]MED4906494.1 hypothetical protein [Parageobacillus thermoglucosidasius]MED4914920.1 hypothetical protein [Parageobacillus thermoglucosidasius]MED4943741.1 hypothetical protein [Parageobacillus thermoglucosidasius]MED4983755.1 hypothetical protein [Parageobacillus thermoglucosidasius]RDE18716.1 hypothetical protein DV714_20520 [Parageobacillus thermoglucosidasius]